MPGAADWRPTCSLSALQARAELYRSIRAFFDERRVLEVHTPCLAPATVTDPHIESIAVPGWGYLQTSPEYQLKRLLAAGVPSLYQLAPAFRADEVGRLHNPEFALLEWYRLGFDDAALMAEVAELVDGVLGPAPYHRVTYAEVVATAAAAAPIELAFAEGLSRLPAGRHFVMDYPPDQAALSRLREGGATAARFELVVDGIELANGYHELGDVAELRRRFAADREARRKLGRAAPELDAEFLAAMAAGLPECAGVALGVDRLLMLQLGADSLAEVLAFGYRQDLPARPA